MTPRPTSRPPGRRARTRRRLALAGWAALAALLIARAAEVQVLERREWASEALRQHRESRVVPAKRGRILERNGGVLAASHPRMAVGIAPKRIRDRARVVAALVERLGVERTAALAATDPERSWSVVPGRYTTTQVAPLEGLAGVHAEKEFRRLHPQGALARPLLGAVGAGGGSGGVEQFMDSTLAGRPGREVVARDSRGREIPGRVVAVEPATTGRDVVLTIDRDLQALAEETLEGAVGATGARGGDMVITDPWTGEILAMTSLVDDSVASLSAVHTTYEPGSTIKPFTSAALLRHGLAALGDSVDVGDGRWRVGDRTITDVDSKGWLTLHEVVRQSSNVGIAKFADRLSRDRQHRNLASFGFGARTGIALPGEVAGVLRPPERWSGASRHSLAFGYELAATPLQMAMAFGALANGGWLMEPVLVKEVLGADGAPVRFGRPRPVRRAVDARVVEALKPVLVDVVESGTGARARMASFAVAGKSGTTRAFSVGGGYEPGAYHASFGAYFPADAPQMLIFVKLDRPRGRYYGGATAAPVTRAAMESLLSARQSLIDREALARSWRRPQAAPPPAGRAAGPPVVRFAALGADAAPELPPEDVSSRAGPAPAMTVPDLAGLPLRVALRRLHKMGLRARLAGRGHVAATVPGPGARALPGDTVRVAGRRR